MPPAKVPTVRQRRLGAALRRLRDTRGFNAEQVAERLSWSTSKVSRIETARIGARVSDVRLLLQLYDVDEHERGELLALAHDASQKGWWAEYPSLPTQYEAFIALEDEADSAFYWSTEVIPGLLQTEAYARRVIEGVSVYAIRPPREVDRRVEVRMRRQRLLLPPRSLQMSVVLDESVLLRRIGDADIMAFQLDRLLELAQMPNLTLRVLPLNGIHYPILGSEFILLTFSPSYDVMFPDIVHVESVMGVNYQDESTTNEYRLAFEQLVDHSLGPERSLALISQVARDRWRAT